MNRSTADAAEVFGGFVGSVVSVYYGLWIMVHGPWVPRLTVADDPSYVPTWFYIHFRAVFFATFFGSLAVGVLGGVFLTRILLRCFGQRFDR